MFWHCTTQGLPLDLIIQIPNKILGIHAHFTDNKLHCYFDSLMGPRGKRGWWHTTRWINGDMWRRWVDLERQWHFWCHLYVLAHICYDIWCFVSGACFLCDSSWIVVLLRRNSSWWVSCSYYSIDLWWSERWLKSIIITCRFYQ